MAQACNYKSNGCGVNFYSEVQKLTFSFLSNETKPAVVFRHLKHDASGILDSQVTAGYSVKKKNLVRQLLTVNVIIVSSIPVPWKGFLA